MTRLVAALIGGYHAMVTLGATGRWGDTLIVAGSYVAVWVLGGMSSWRIADEPEDGS